MISKSYTFWIGRTWKNYWTTKAWKSSNATLVKAPPRKPRKTEKTTENPKSRQNRAACHRTCKVWRWKHILINTWRCIFFCLFALFRTDLRLSLITACTPETRPASNKHANWVHANLLYSTTCIGATQIVVYPQALAEVIRKALTMRVITVLVKHWTLLLHPWSATHPSNWNKWKAMCYVWLRCTVGRHIQHLHAIDQLLHGLCDLKNTARHVVGEHVGVSYGKLLVKPTSKLPSGCGRPCSVVPAIQDGHIHAETLQLHHPCLHHIASHW